MYNKNAEVVETSAFYVAERGGFELDDDDETLVMKGGQPRRSGCSQTFKKYIVLEPDAALYKDYASDRYYKSSLKRYVNYCRISITAYITTHFICFHQFLIIGSAEIQRIHSSPNNIFICVFIYRLI